MLLDLCQAGESLIEPEIERWVCDRQCGSDSCAGIRAEVAADRPSAGSRRCSGAVWIRHDIFSMNIPTSGTQAPEERWCILRNRVCHKRFSFQPVGFRFPTCFFRIFRATPVLRAAHVRYIEISGFPVPSVEFYRRAVLVHHPCDRQHTRSMHNDSQTGIRSWRKSSTAAPTRWLA